MKTFFIPEVITYDGTQLRSLFAYLQYEILGDSLVSWLGPCHIDREHMVDGEDLLQNSKISSDCMLHFIMECFATDLRAMVCYQRLLADHLVHNVFGRVASSKELKRCGDDVYWGEKKLNISIATVTPTSSLLHFAINVTNEGTPVRTCCLPDFGIKDFPQFSQDLMSSFVGELLSIQRATQKVKWVR